MALRTVVSVIYLITLPFVLPVLALMAFYADPGSYTINAVGKILLVGYSLSYLLAVYISFRALVLWIAKISKS